MIEAQARVVRAAGDIAYVEARTPSGCGSCGSEKECGTSLLAQIFGGARREFRVVNPVGAKPGDSVVIGLEEGGVLKGSLTVYLLPLALLFGGAIGGIALAPTLAAQEMYSILGAGIGLAAGFAWMKLQSASHAASRCFQPVILRKSNEFSCTVIKER